jgi:hypothetical protein
MSKCENDHSDSVVPTSEQHDQLRKSEAQCRGKPTSYTRTRIGQERRTAPRLHNGLATGGSRCLPYVTRFQDDPQQI